jgi:hypothetical protein
MRLSSVPLLWVLQRMPLNIGKSEALRLTTLVSIVASATVAVKHNWALAGGPCPGPLSAGQTSVRSRGCAGTHSSTTIRIVSLVAGESNPISRLIPKGRTQTSCGDTIKWASVFWSDHSTPGLFSFCFGTVLGCVNSFCSGRSP